VGAPLAEPADVSSETVGQHRRSATGVVVRRCPQVPRRRRGLTQVAELLREGELLRAERVPSRRRHLPARACIPDNS
jgi:hypothetical protein